MHVERLHKWSVNVHQALGIQRNLATKVLQAKGFIDPHLIVGLDVAISNKREAVAAAVVLNYPDLKVVEIAIVKGKVDFPYIPGLLSFREVPLTLRACEQLRSTPDLVMVDGQGLAHPRRMGLASHLGLFLNLPTIGCAKSHLYGELQEPELEFGATGNIFGDAGEIIGAVVRTRAGVKPLFVSVGHKIDLSTCVHWVLECCRGYRLPEPTRLAHLASQEKF